MTEITRIEAPFTDEQVQALNAYQRAGFFHPFTCGERDTSHSEHREATGGRDDGLLVADNDGWRCPVCGYRQNWAHSFMADPAVLEAQERSLGGLRRAAQQTVDHQSKIEP